MLFQYIHVHDLSYILLIISVDRQGTSIPETTTDDYNHVKQLIEKYKPSSRKQDHIPVINSEWGYSELYAGSSREVQGKYICRQYLNAIANEIPLTIYYDWHNDCLNKTDPGKQRLVYGKC